MRALMMLVFVTFAWLLAAGQTQPHKAPAQPSHRFQVLSRLNIVDVQFKVSCAKSADHTSNQRCATEMLRQLQNTYPKLSLQEIRVPKNFQPTAVVLVFKEEALMDEDTLTLTVYETENNDELYSDSRNELILSNDLTKLLGGYVESTETE